MTSGQVNNEKNLFYTVNWLERDVTVIYVIVVRFHIIKLQLNLECLIADQSFVNGSQPEFLLTRELQMT